MTEANIIRILIADDHAVVREGLRSYLALASDIEVVGEATNGWETLELAQAHAPDIILMDLIMPKLNGLDTLRAMQDLENFSAKTIIVTSFSAREQVVEAVKLGASGYLLKDSHPKQIVQAVRDVYYGQTSFHASVTASLVAELAKPPEPTPAQYDLSEREYETLKLVAQGLSNREIAEKMVVSERTVGSHVSNILEKLNLSNRTQAALFALREGIAELDPK